MGVKLRPAPLRRNNFLQYMIKDGPHAEKWYQFRR
jgi:hypothetical protein